MGVPWPQLFVTQNSMPNACRNLCFQVILRNPHYQNLVTLNLQGEDLVETRNLEAPNLNLFLCYTRRVQFKSEWSEMTKLVLTLISTKIQRFLVCCSCFSLRG